MNNDHPIVSLKDIATIRLGYPFRLRVERDPKGRVGVIQMKDIDEYNQIDLSDVYRVQIEDLEKQHLLRREDILFRSRGVSYTAALVATDLDQFVAASPLMVIRDKSKLVLPAYLTWFINHPYGQQLLNRLAKGTNQQMVSKSALETLEIALPPLSKQQAIVELGALELREQQLMDTLTQKRKTYIDAILLKQARRPAVEPET